MMDRETSSLTVVIRYVSEGPAHAVSTIPHQMFSDLFFDSIMDNIRFTELLQS